MKSVALTPSVQCDVRGVTMRFQLTIIQPCFKQRLCLRQAFTFTSLNVIFELSYKSVFNKYLCIAIFHRLCRIFLIQYWFTWHRCKNASLYHFSCLPNLCDKPIPKHIQKWYIFNLWNQDMLDTQRICFIDLCYFLNLLRFSWRFDVLRYYPLPQRTMKYAFIFTWVEKTCFIFGV